MTRRLGLAAIGVGSTMVATMLGAIVRWLLEARRGPAPPGGEAIGIEWAVGVGAVALGLCVWLIVAAMFQLLVELCPVGRRLRVVADAIAPASMRRVGRRVATAAATVSLAVAPIGPAIPVTRAGVVQQEAGPRAELTPLVTAPPATAHLAPVPMSGPTSESEAQPLSGPPLVPAGTEVVVQPGDDFWHLAEVAVTASVGHRPTEHEVAAYWVRLIAVNRDRLVVAGVPDLLYPGQVLRLPGTEAPSGPGAELPETR